MAVVAQKTVLSELSVKDAMRWQVVALFQEAPMDKAIRHLIKYKVNALLTTDGDGLPAGVVSKTDIMGAYYAGLPLDAPLDHIMVGPPVFCQPQDPLESALDIMRDSGVYRLYVRAEPQGEAVGVLAYPDIVGLLYQYCHSCEYSRFNRRGKQRPRLTVREVMTPSVTGFQDSDSLLAIMEGLSQYRFGAVLMRDSAGKPVGVVSKTDLILAYRHGLAPETPARDIICGPVRSCPAEDYLETAIKRLIFSDIHRIFVHGQTPADIVGVLSLTDAARVRSGSCRACVASRIRPES